MTEVNNKPLVSVIIPTYNRKKTISRSIQSVLNQTYENIELIIVDDGSTDGTKELVIEKYGDAVVYVENQRKKGPSGARNYGVQIANGEYIAFQDSDDEWNEKKLERQMEILLTNTDIKMVYCEIKRYREEEFLDTRPDPQMPVEQKQGNLFSYLILQPLIGTPTMLVDKEAFTSVGGFEETLGSLVDYEFSIRFSHEFLIGFAEDTYVKAYNSEGSVCKRWKEATETRIHILQKWYAEYASLNLSRQMVALIIYAADCYGGRKFAIEELKKVRQISESQELYSELENWEFDKESADNKFKVEGKEKIIHIKDMIDRLYHKLEKREIPWNSNIGEVLYSVIESLKDYTETYGLDQLRESMKQTMNVDDIKNLADGLVLIQEILKVCDVILAYIEEHMHWCNVCKNDVFFLPIPPDHEKLRRQNGFIYWNAEFQLESKDNYICPVCKLKDRDRLIIAFLEMIQAENEERLRMLQVAPAPAIENYALGRTDISYESTDLLMSDVTFQADLQNMSMVEDETYDIIVCAHVLEHVEDDIQAMHELYRILKPKGVCLILVPLIVGRMDTDEQWGCTAAENWRRFGQGDHCRLYGKEDFIKRLDKVGFHVNELGKEWFGEEFYQRCGFDEYSILYVATKEIELVQTDNSELSDLYAENALLRQALENVNSKLAEIEKFLSNQTSINRMLSENGKSLNSLISINSRKIDNLRWEISDPRIQETMWHPQIMSIEDTINEIVENKKSIARFGDGEFGIMCGVQRWRFQKNDEKLAHRLKEVLQSEEKDILIGLIDFYGDLSTSKPDRADGLRSYLTPEVRKQHYALLSRSKLYANAVLSRNVTWEMVRNQKRIWDGRDCIFIEGFQTRMGIGNDLFDNAASIKRILCPAESAFDRYDEILGEALKQPKDKLMLIALGPTASVLAYDLAKAGYQAIDIGHADVSYEWLLRGGDHISIPHKYVNEVSDGYIVDEIHDPVYESQIIADFH